MSLKRGLLIVFEGCDKRQENQLNVNYYLKN